MYGPYGYAKLLMEYDERGNLTKLAYIGTDGKLMLGSEGYAGWTKEYDENGELIGTAYFGLDGEALPADGG